MNKIILSIYLIFIVNISKAQQNTILIIADDVSPDYFGCFSTTTDTAVAPNINALSQRAVRFSKVWASPICSPTRAGIFTGRYPFRTGVGQVITNATSPQIDTAEMSIAKLLKWYAPQKYNTACVGKWHLNNNQPSKRLNPNVMGYDFYAGNFNGAITDYYSWQRIKNGIQDTVATYATTQTINDAISWLDTMSTTKPFFLWVAFNAPHSPYHLPPANLCNTTGLTGITSHINANPKLYFKASIEAMDNEIGRLFQYLTANNLMDSTNIIFMGDNGNANQVAQITNPAKAKNTIYDYGARVPFMVAGPAVVNPNRASNELINTPDLFVTIAELCGFTNWKNAIPTSTKVDSRSFLPILKNQTSINRTWIFTEQFSSPAVASDGKTIRNQDYHLLRYDNGTEEFYNQTIDKEENNNLLVGAMTTTDMSNYHFLCDSIISLTGSGTCKPLAINEIDFQDKIDVFPNPTSDIITIQLNHVSTRIIDISLLDMSGRIIKEAQIKLGSKTAFLNTRNLSNGTYFVKVSDRENSISKKVVLSK
jgi:arylsulfatase A-like enzyme